MAGEFPSWPGLGRFITSAFLLLGRSPRRPSLGAQLQQQLPPDTRQVDTFEGPTLSSIPDFVFNRPPQPDRPRRRGGGPPPARPPPNYYPFYGPMRRQSGRQRAECNLDVAAICEGQYEAGTDSYVECIERGTDVCRTAYPSGTENEIYVDTPWEAITEASTGQPVPQPQPRRRGPPRRRPKKPPPRRRLPTRPDPMRTVPVVPRRPRPAARPGGAGMWIPGPQMAEEIHRQSQPIPRGPPTRPVIGPPPISRGPLTRPVIVGAPSFVPELVNVSVARLPMPAPLPAPLPRPAPAPAAAPRPAPLPRPAPAARPVPIPPWLQALPFALPMLRPGRGLQLALQPRPTTVTDPGTLNLVDPLPRGVPPGQTPRPLTPFQPGALTLTSYPPVPKEALDRCECPKKRKPKKRKERTECRTGTYTETKRGTLKRPQRKIACQ